MIAREKDTWAILCTLMIIVWKIFVFLDFYFLNSPQKKEEIFIDEIKNYLSIINCTRKGYVDHFMYIDDYRLKSICNRIHILFLHFLNSLQKPLSMKTRIISRLLIAREKDTWAILCTLMIIVWKVFIIEYIFFFYIS